MLASSWTFSSVFVSPRRFRSRPYPPRASVVLFVGDLHTQGRDSARVLVRVVTHERQLM